MNTKKNTSEKILFVNNLLEYVVRNNVNSSTKERLFTLIGKEVENTGLNRIQIEAIVDEKLEKINKSLSLPIDSTPDSKNVKKNHSAKTMVDFLQKFSKDENFKWFTHDPDFGLETFNYLDYIIRAERELKGFTAWDINYITYANVRNFIYDTGYQCRVFDEKDIKIVWKDLKSWCDLNPGIHPFSAEIGSGSFKTNINRFKNTIEFRTDDTDMTFNLRLKKFIRKTLSSDIKKTFTESFDHIGSTVNVYIDVNLFFTGLSQILKWININKSKSDSSIFNLIDFEEYYCLEIFHENSYMSVDSKSSKINGLSGDFEKVRRSLFCVADWDIYADLRFSNRNESCKITCLDVTTELLIEGKEISFTQNIIDSTIEHVNGVRHILKFYKTINI